MTREEFNSRLDYIVASFIGSSNIRAAAEQFSFEACVRRHQ